MFWPFTRWTFRPPPWGPSKWNTPVEERQGSFAEARPHNYPKYAARWQAELGTPVAEYWTSPIRPVGAYSKHPAGAYQAVADAGEYIRALSESALLKNAAGLPLSLEEAQALMVVSLPPVYTPRVRGGAGMRPDWDVPFVPRDRVPDDIAARKAQMIAIVEQSRRNEVGQEIAYIEAIRAQMLAQTRGPGR